MFSNILLADVSFPRFVIGGSFSFESMGVIKSKKALDRITGERLCSTKASLPSLRL